MYIHPSIDQSNHPHIHVYIQLCPYLADRYDAVSELSSYAPIYAHLIEKLNFKVYLAQDMFRLMGNIGILTGFWAWQSW